MLITAFFALLPFLLGAIEIPLHQEICIPGTGSYATLEIPFSGSLTGISFTYISGDIVWWPAGNGRGRWGLPDRINIWVTKDINPAASNILFPLASTSKSYWGFYAYKPYRGDSKVLVLRGSAHSFGIGDKIRVYFGEYLFRPPSSDNQGCTRATATFLYSGSTGGSAMPSCTSQTYANVGGSSIAGKSVSSGSECLAWCKNRLDCKCWAYEPGAAGYCWIKGSSASCSSSSNAYMISGRCYHPPLRPYVTLKVKPGARNYAACDGLYAKDNSVNLLNGAPVYLNTRRHRFMGWNGYSWALTGLQYLTHLRNNQVRGFGAFHFASRGAVPASRTTWRDYNVVGSLPDGTMLLCGTKTYFILYGTKRYVPNDAILNVFTNTNHRLTFQSEVCDNIFEGPALSTDAKIIKCNTHSSLKWLQTSNSKRLVCDSSTMSRYKFKSPSTTTSDSDCESLCSRDTICNTEVPSHIYYQRNDHGPSCEPSELQQNRVLQTAIINSFTLSRRRLTANFEFKDNVFRRLQTNVVEGGIKMFTPVMSYQFPGSDRGFSLDNPGTMNPSEDYTGIILYEDKDGNDEWVVYNEETRKSLTCRTGDILILKSAAFAHRESQWGQVHGKMYQHIFGHEIDKGSEMPLGSGFGYQSETGEWAYRSGVFNSNKYKWDNGAHGIDKGMRDVESPRVHTAIERWARASNSLSVTPNVQPYGVAKIEAAQNTPIREANDVPIVYHEHGEWVTHWWTVDNGGNLGWTFNVHANSHFSLARVFPNTQTNVFFIRYGTKYLSSTSNGDQVHFVDDADQSGRQWWWIVQHENTHYRIRVYAGVPNRKRWLRFDGGPHLEDDKEESALKLQWYDFSDLV